MIRLVSDGNGWDGTAALAIGLVIEDILSDGEPFEATVTVELEYGGTRTFKATIHALTGAEVSMTSHATGALVQLNTEEIRELLVD